MGGNGGLGVVGSLIYFAIIVLMIASVWKTFSKAGQPGWASIIPIYNLIVLIQIARKPLWWIVLFLVPVVNIVVLFMLAIAVARNFGHGTGFGVGLVFLPFIFYPILGFGESRYLGATVSGEVYRPAVT